MNSTKPRPVFALWIDAGDVVLIKRWMSEGHLPNLKQLADGGLFAALEGMPFSRAEIMQCVAITGCRPETSGYWGQHWYDPQTYQVTERGPYRYERRPPFFALGGDFQVAVVDLPQYKFHGDVHGWQVVGWGAHHPMASLHSDPPEVVRDIVKLYGEHPTRQPELEYANLEDRQSMERLFAGVIAGVQQRTKMTIDLARRRPWDLFVTLIAETHKGGHYLYPHPGNLWFLGEEDPFRCLRELYVEVDRAVGRLHEALQDTYQFALFSLEGISLNADEVKSIFLLPDILTRRCFGGRGAFEFDETKRTPSPESQAGIFDWTMEAWNMRRPAAAGSEQWRTRLSPAAVAAREMQQGLPPAPFHPNRFPYLPYQPAMWLSPYWPHMEAFALPSFTDGLVRINLQGREGQGRVAGGDYERVCRDVTAALESFRDPASGRPLVKEVIRTRTNGCDDDVSLPYGDLVVIWEDDANTHFVSDVWGEVGPVPPLRAGAHPPHGFLIAAGSEATPCGETVAGHVLDIAPTILDMLGAEPPAPLDGKSLLPIRPSRSAA